MSSVPPPPSLSSAEETPVRTLRWLRDELPKLEAAQVLDGASAEGLRSFYRLDALPPPRNLTLLIFGVMGAGLFGAGLILIVAHNWDELSRAMRAGLAMGLLLLAQSIAGWVLARRPDSPTWTEASALTLTLWIGASIALISQTYHIEGDLGDFLVSWLMLAIPVFYLLNSRIAAVICLLLALGVPNASWTMLDRNAAYFLIIALCIPFVVWSHLNHARDLRTTLLDWTTALTIPVGLAMVIMNALSGTGYVGVLFFAALFSAMVAWGSGQEGEPPSFTSPLSTIGMVGVSGIALAHGFVDAWSWDGLATIRADLAGRGAILTAIGAAVLAVYPTSRAQKALRDKEWPVALACGLPVVLLMGNVLLNLNSVLGIILGNLFAFALGLLTLLSGLESNLVRRTNVGLLILAMLFMLRFFDSDLPLYVRGLGMMGIGVAFAVVNIRLVRRADRAKAGEEGAS